VICFEIDTSTSSKESSRDSFWTLVAWAVLARLYGVWAVALGVFSQGIIENSISYLSRNPSIKEYGVVLRIACRG
jgi:hypothetical protein